ncbi:MAG: hypothetical protein IJG17_04455, partial [Eubacterium sp.]|nr:hypothetical protein [Eubacterium sp.]
MKAVIFKTIHKYLKKIKQPGSSIVAVLVVFVMVFAMAAPAFPAAAAEPGGSSGGAAADGTGKSNASDTSKDDSANANAAPPSGNDNSSVTDNDSAEGRAQNGTTDGNQGSAEFVIDTETDKSLSGAADTNEEDSAGDIAQSDSSGTSGADGNSQPGSDSDLHEEMVITTVTSPAQAEGIGAASETKTIVDVEYHPFASLTAHPESDHVYVDDDIVLAVSFTMEDLAQANFYGEILYDPDKIDYSLARGKITLDGGEAGTYEVKIVDGHAYLCISLDDEHAAGSAGRGDFAMTAVATAAGEIRFNNEVITIYDPSDEKYDNISVTKSATGPQPVVSGEHQGEYVYSYEVILKNNNDEPIDNLTVFDCPNYMNNASNYKDGAWPSWPEDTTRIDLQYPDKLPGNGNDYTLTLTESPDKLPGTSRRYNEYQCTGVSIDPGQELKWTYEVYLTAAEAAKVERLQKTAYWTNYAGFRVGNQKIKEVSRAVSFTPDTTPMTKIGALPKEEGGDMEWTIALETKGSYNAAGKYISDHLKKDAVSEGDDLHFILDNTGAEQPYAVVYRNGVKQDGKVMLTWERVDDATKLTSGEPTKLYYDEAGNFIWFSEEQTDANYGYQLHDWTSFKTEWMGLDSINQAASNFSDRTMKGIDGDYEADISLTKKLLLYDENNRSADWEINVPVYLTHPVSNVYLRDYLPTAARSLRQDNLRDTMDYMGQIHLEDTAGGSLVYTQDEEGSVTNANNEKFRLVHRYWEFNSVAEFEAFTGIHIEVTGTLGAGTQSTGAATADAVLCTHGKLGFYASTYLYADSGKPAGGLWFIYPNAVTAANTSISSSGMRNLASTLPEGDYNIWLNYRSTTPASCTKDETNINYVYLNGTTALGNNFSLNAYAAYYMYPTRDGEESIDKKIAKVEHKANGKIDITYMVLADNRSTKYNGTTIHTTNTYDDFLSGLPAGAAKLVIPDPGKRDGVRIYKIPATYNPDDPTGWTLREAHSVEELDKSENGYLLITDPLTDRNKIPGEWWGGITRERMDENGFNVYVPYSYTINQ